MHRPKEIPCALLEQLGIRFAAESCLYLAVGRVAYHAYEAYHNS
jgi:hypothetical protein